MMKAKKILVALLLASPFFFSFDRKGSGNDATTYVAPDGDDKEGEAKESDEIKWMTLEEVQSAMKKEPRKVYIDVYTDWCGWCKVMERKTFSNKNVAKYLNDHFYAVRFNAEQKDSIQFLGHKYGFVDQYRANELAVNLMQGKMSYPTSIVLEQNFQNPQPIPGYLDVEKMEMILTYLYEEKYKTTPFDQWQQSFKATW